MLDDKQIERLVEEIVAPSRGIVSEEHLEDMRDFAHVLLATHPVVNRLATELAAPPVVLQSDKISKDDIRDALAEKKRKAEG